MQLNYMPTYGDESSIPFLTFGKRYYHMMSTHTTKFKKLNPSWNWRAKTQVGRRNNMGYIDISSTQIEGVIADKNFQDDILLPLLRTITEDSSLRTEEMPTRYTKRRPSVMPVNGHQNND